MGWMKTSSGVWGDAPQDIVSDWLEKKGFNWETQKGEKSPLTRKLASRARKSRLLKKRVDSEYSLEYERPSTPREYNHLINVGLGLTTTQPRRK